MTHKPKTIKFRCSSAPARLTLPVEPQSIHRALRQPEPAPKVVTFGIHRLQKRTGTVSETVSENSKMIVENSGGLKRINLYFAGVFAILLELNRTLQVPKGQLEISQTHCVWFVPQ